MGLNISKEERNKILNSKEYHEFDAEIKHLAEIMTIPELTTESCKYLLAVSTKIKNESIKNDNLFEKMAAVGLLERVKELTFEITKFGMLADTMITKEKNDDGC